MPRTINSFHCRLLASLSILSIFFITGCATLPTTTEPPYLSIVSIEPVAMTPLEQKYQLTVRLQNPNDQALNVSGMSYVLEVNGQSLLKGVSNEAVTVSAYGESVIQLTGISTLFGIAHQLQALRGNTSGNISYKLRGKLSLSNRLGSVPFSYEGRLLPAGSSSDDI